MRVVEPEVDEAGPIRVRSEELEGPVDPTEARSGPLSLLSISPYCPHH
jgi:hypothetical protein